MSIRLFATDMDGTLLTDSEKSFDTAAFADLLARFKKEGIYFVVATGNQYPKSLQYMKEFAGQGLYYIAENGAYIADGQKDLRVTSFSRETVEAVLAVLADLPQVGVVFSTHQGAYIHQERADRITAIVREHLGYLADDYALETNYLDFMRRFYPGSQEIADYGVLLEKSVVKFALMTHKADTEAVLDYLNRELPQEIVPVQSGFGAIDLISRGTNKGTALAWLAERLGVAAEEIMAFGDAPNDLEMLQYAGVGVAMGNASPGVKAVAQQVIGNNNDGAVLTHIAEVLEKQGSR